MSHLAEGIDSVPLETRAESARVESGSEALDPVDTKIAFDQEQRITRKPGYSVAEDSKEKQFSPFLPAFDKKPHARSASAEIMAYQEQYKHPSPACKYGVDTVGAWEEVRNSPRSFRRVRNLRAAFHRDPPMVFGGG
jgi:hypothetical protein